MTFSWAWHNMLSVQAPEHSTSMATLLDSSDGAHRVQAHDIDNKFALVTEKICLKGMVVPKLLPPIRHEHVAFYLYLLDTQAITYSLPRRPKTE